MQTKHLAVPFEMKAVDEEGVFEGYGSVFGNRDLGNDIVEPGAFSKSIEEDQAAGRSIPILRNHDPNNVIGVMGAISEDARGLKVAGRLFLEIQSAREVHTAMKNSVMRGLSIGYRVRQHFVDRTNGVRHLKDVKLWEVSVVTFPMNELATASSVKGAEMDPDLFSEFLAGHLAHLAPVIAEKGWREAIRNFEALLREEGGFSNKAATAIASFGFKSDPQPRDEGGEVLNGLLASIKSARAGIPR